MQNKQPEFINQKPEKKYKNLIFFVLVGFLLFAIVIINIYNQIANIHPGNGPFIPGTTQDKKDFTLLQAKSEQEIKEYLAQAKKNATTNNYSLRSATEAFTTQEVGMTDINMTSKAQVDSQANRVSSTNVQVLSIDEPDIVKNDKQFIYYSKPQTYRYEPVSIQLKNTQPKNVKVQSNTKIIKAFPPVELSEISSIDVYGDLLLNEDKLMVLEDKKITAYSLKNKQNPTEEWKYNFENDVNIKTARLYNNQLYVVAQKRIYDNYDPCPIITRNPSTFQIDIACRNVYYPNKPDIQINTEYIILQIDPQNGKVSSQTAFLGSRDSIFYMSENAMYLSYSYQKNYLDIIYDFVQTDGQNIFPEDLKNKLTKLYNLDISDAAKMVEYEYIFDSYLASLDKDEARKLENEIENKMNDYAKNHIRDFEETSIAKVTLKDIKVDKIGTVPGRPLNQFSMDEFNDHLRIATNCDYSYGFSTSQDSVNDVYILDRNLNKKGSVEDLGEGERIYSVRFLGNRGYVVTFKQIDPFYVLDLSSPNNPEMKGELKIPGYSSYLHPLKDNLILGIGRDNSSPTGRGWNLKASLFDVSNPSNPQEVAKYFFDDYSSDVIQDHHAFLQDSKHEIMFIPGTRDGYILSYKNNNITLEKVVADIQAERAVYMDDYLYIIGKEKIEVIDENSFDSINDLNLN